MIFEETFAVGASHDAVAELFADVERVSRCVPGIEDIQQIGDDRYRATLSLRVGPIATRFAGDLQMDDSRSPERFTARGRGADTRTGSQVEVSFAGDLQPRGPQRTEVRAHVDVTIRGRLGQFGTGIITATGQQILHEFAGCLNATLASADLPVEGEGERQRAGGWGRRGEGERQRAGGWRSTAAAPPPLWRVLLRGVGVWLRQRLRNLRRRPAHPSARRLRPEHPRPEPTGGSAPPPSDAAPPVAARGPVFVEPDTVDDACRLLADHADDARAIAGGTAVVLMMQQGLIRPQVLVSLSRITPLRALERRDGAVRIGAGTTLTEVAASPLVREQLPALAYACHRVGNVRIRNVATLGGNLAEADYASDPPAMLAGLGATCTVRGPTGTRTVAVADLITGFYDTVLEPGELITEILVPVPAGERRSAYRKYISRSSEDRPCVGVAVRADFSGATVDELEVVVGAVAPVLQRLPDVTARVVGRPLEDDAIAEVSRGYAQGIEPMSDARGSAWYRRRMIEVFVRRALEDLRAEQPEAVHQ